MIAKVVAGVCTMACAAIVQTPLPAQAATYRYWSYWTGGDQWSYSSRGPAFRVPGDASVEGWRFVVSPRDGSQATAPSSASSFEQLCPEQPAAAAGQKRVAVVIDYGPAGIAPVDESPPATSTSCLTVPANATGLQVLQEAAKLRFHSSGLICGIAGFPATECPGQSSSSVTTPPTTATPARTPVQLAPTPATVSTPGALPTRTPNTGSQTPSAGDRPTQSPSPSDAPSAVALTQDEPRTPEAQQPDAPPAWVAAIGAALIAALLGLALLMRRGRE